MPRKSAAEAERVVQKSAKRVSIWLLVFAYIFVGVKSRFHLLYALFHFVNFWILPLEDIVLLEYH
jgi:hypothetical protein